MNEEEEEFVDDLSLYNFFYSARCKNEERFFIKTPLEFMQSNEKMSFEGAKAAHLIIKARMSRI